MDTPGHDIESVTGMVAGGTQVVIFTTGRGTPTGCPVAPVIKMTGCQKRDSRFFLAHFGRGGFRLPARHEGG